MPSLSAERVEPRKETFVSIEVFPRVVCSFPVLLMLMIFYYHFK